MGKNLRTSKNADIPKTYEHLRLNRFLLVLIKKKECIVKYSTVQYFTELYNTEGELYSTVQDRRRVVEGHHSTR